MRMFNTKNQNNNQATIRKSPSSKIKPGCSNNVITRILLRPEWRLHLAHIGTIIYQSTRSSLLYLLIDDRSPHLSVTLIRYFIEDLKWLELPNVKIVRITDYYKQLLHCVNWFIDHGETHLEKIIIRKNNSDCNPQDNGERWRHDHSLTPNKEPYQRDGRDQNKDRRIKKYFLHEVEIPKVKKYFSLNNLTRPREDYVIETTNGKVLCGCCGAVIEPDDEDEDEDQEPDDETDQYTNEPNERKTKEKETQKGKAKEKEEKEKERDKRIKEMETEEEKEKEEEKEGEGEGEEEDYLITEEELMNLSLNELSETSKLRLRTNESPSSILMNYYLDRKKCDLNLSFCLPVIDCLLGVTNIIEQNYPPISDETHKFNQKIFHLLGSSYPRYESHPGYKLLHYRYHSASIIDMIKNGRLLGYDDPRLLTIRNLKHRGFPADLIKQFARQGIIKGIIDPQQLPDICKTFFLNAWTNRNLCLPSSQQSMTSLKRYSGIVNPIRIVLENFPLNMTRYFSSLFSKDMLCLRKLLWIDNASLNGITRNNFTLKGTTTQIHLKQKTPNQGFLRGDVVDISNRQVIDRPVIPWLSCDPVESPFQVHFLFYPEFYTGQENPHEIKLVDGLLNQKPDKGIIIVQNYGFFFFDGIDELHLMCAFPKAKTIMDRKH